MRKCKQLVVGLFLLLLAGTHLLSARPQHEGHTQQPAQPQKPKPEQSPPPPPASQQNPPTGHQMQHPKAESVPAQTAAARNLGPAYRLADLEQMALESNPTLKQAETEIRAAGGRRRQAGLLPNPSIGYVGEEIRGGRQRGGQHGFFVEQPIILGGKLSAGRRVFEQEIRLAELEAEEQRLRVVNAVRLGFYQVLTSQERLKLLDELTRVAGDSAVTSKRLANLGQLDETEVLQAEIELQRTQLAVMREETRLRHLWTALAAVVGRPQLEAGTVEGRLDDNLPRLDEQEVTARLLSQSPAVRITETSISRAEAELSRARRQAIPDLLLRGGLQQNRELIESTGRPVGMQGFAEVGIQLPIFNRNQGNVEAAKAQRDRAQHEQARVQLVLRERAAGLVQNYRDARIRVERYQREIVPRAQRSYDLMLRRWGQMAASYPQLLFAQRTLFQVQTDYIVALGDVWASSIALEGFLLTDGLEAPARPGEVDLPVREINIPTPRGGAGRED